MSGSVNKVILVGNVTADPEIRSTQSGQRIANFSVATNDSWRDKSTGEKREKSEFHRVVIFSEGLAKIAEQYMKKGSKVYLEGQLQTRKWTDQSGAEKYSTEIVLQGFNAALQLLDSREGSSEPRQAQNRSTSSASAQAPAWRDDGQDIPFRQEWR